ncbi:UV radiation resistance-associated protein isoform X1 [Octopus sinensis]|uniref:UV radiation resistance-associated protein isoform X1 n=1 Tax=Octopus sinensis TaxID=2607531 RepID=A0A6P7ST42_9MOLL|nr:UV radiation resistance-associated protein isoform X1 [Octopus sinensis]XP_036362207.1 UV radiation resistance-associated protein isoform X1 [Octopus sinensis]
MASDSDCIVSNVFELATQQKRIRHLKSVSLRNLVYKDELGTDNNKLSTFFTLHTDAKSPAFYTSEKISGSLNPTWQAFDLTTKSEEVETSKKSLLVRVWVGHDVFKLFLEWEVFLSCLHLQDTKTMKDGIRFPPNSLVFGMFHHFFVAPTEEELEKCTKFPRDISRSFYQTEHSNLIFSYGHSSLTRINTILRAIRQNKASAKRLRHDIQQQLQASKERNKKLSEKEELLLRVHQLQSEMQWQSANLQSQKEERDSLTNDNHIRKTFLQEQYAAIKVERTELEEKRKNHNSLSRHITSNITGYSALLEDLSVWGCKVTKGRKCFITRSKSNLSDKSRAKDSSCNDMLSSSDEELFTKENEKNFNIPFYNILEHLVKENAQLWIRRKQLITELAEYIYPITEDSNKQFFICDVKLPNAEDIQGHDDTMVAVGLGYTCHMILMLSHILNLPLRYPMEYRGSRSQIQDHIHTKLSERERNFPLYSKGKKDFYFHYGVYLLNKNISQLRWYCGLGTADLRLTLPNLKSLLELRLGVRSEQSSHLSPVPSNLQDYISPSGQMTLIDSATRTAVCEIDELEGVVDTSSKLSPTGTAELAMEATSELPSPMTASNGVQVTEDMFQRTDDSFFQIQRPVTKMFSLSNESFLNNSNCDNDMSEQDRTISSSGDLDCDNSKLTSAWLKKFSPGSYSPSTIRSAGHSPKLPYRHTSGLSSQKLSEPTQSEASVGSNSSTSSRHSSLPQQYSHEDTELCSNFSAASLADSSQNYWTHRPDNVCNKHHSNDDYGSLNSI